MYTANGLFVEGLIEDAKIYLVRWNMDNTEWIKCPICRNKTRNKIRQDTLLKNYPLYCPKCKNEVLIEIEDMKVKIIREPDAKTQSR